MILTNVGFQGGKKERGGKVLGGFLRTREGGLNYPVHR